MALTKLIPAMLALGILSSLAACSPVTTCSSTPTSQIEDSTWNLASYGDSSNPQNVIVGTTVTIIFRSSNDQVEGYGGCNNYGGNYEIDGTKLTVSGLVSTKIYCTQPPGVSDQETSYLEILQAADSLQISGARLQINAGNRVLVYTRQG